MRFIVLHCLVFLLWQSWLQSMSALYVALFNICAHWGTEFVSSVSWWLFHKEKWSPAGKLFTLRNDFWFFSQSHTWYHKCSTQNVRCTCIIKMKEVLNIYFFLCFKSLLKIRLMSLCGSFCMLESFQLYHGVLHMFLAWRPKEIPWNAEDVLFPSIHSAVENHSPTYIYNMSYISQVASIPPCL